MTSKKCYVALLVTAFMFAVFAVGGCGGSSSSLPGNNSESEVTEIPNITDIFDSEEFAVVMQDLEAELSADNLTTLPDFHFITILSGEVILDDNIESSTAKGSPVKGSALSQNEIQKLADALKGPYESGDVIALLFPSNETVNDLCLALGEQPAFVDLNELLSQDKENQPDSADLYLEIYAMAKRYNGKSAHTFSYVMPGNAKIMAEVIVEILSEDAHVDSSAAEMIASETSSDSEIEYFNEKFGGLRREYVFQARRYADFIRWAAHIDRDMEEQKAESSSVFKSAADSTNLFDYSAQKISVNFDYSGTLDWGTRSYGVYIGKHNYSYSAGASYMVYSYHDFGDGRDYYVVRSSVYVKPDVEKWNTNGWVCTFGSMRNWSYTHDLNSGNPSYVLFNNAPPNVDRSMTVSGGTSHSTSSTTSHSLGTKVGAKVGVSTSQGLSAEINTEISAETTNSATNGSSYSHSETWTTDEYSITNECDNKAAKWTVDFKDPNDGYFSHWDGSIQPATTRRTDLNSEWMWQVNDSNKVMNLSAHLYRVIRLTYANGPRATAIAYGTYNRGPYRLAQPPHIVLTSQNNYTFDKNGANNNIIKFMSDDDWEIISAASDWCYVSDEQQKGGRTNGENSVFFYVDPYDTGSTTRAHTRQALLVVRNTVTKQVQTVLITQSNR